MNKEQQIKEMTQDFINFGITTRQGVEAFAEILYNAGYRKISEDNICEAVEKPVDTPKRKYESIDGIVSEFVVKDGNILYGTNILDGYRHEFKDIHEICDELNNNMKKIDRLMELNNHLRFQLEESKKSTVKEFAEKLKKKVHNYYPSIDSYCTSKHVILVKDIDELLKEYEK